MSSLVFRLHVLVAFVAAGAAELTPPAANAEDPTVRVAFSQSQFVGVNQNDAMAAMKVYFRTIAEDERDDR